MTIEFLQIEPTTRCNFTCGFCCGRTMEQSDLDLVLFERALTKFPQLRYIELQGEGEPFLHPQILDMLALARQRGMIVSLITNGSLLTDHVSAQLVKDGVEKVSISIESADPAVFRNIRGGKLDKVVDGIRRLVVAKAGRTLPRIGFSVTMLRSAPREIDGIIALYRQLGLDGGITTQPLQRMPGYLSGYPAEMRAELLNDREADARYIDFYRRTRTIANPAWSNGGFYARLMSGWKPTTRRCPWLDRGAYVSRNGVVTACCMIKDERHSLGRIDDHPAKLFAGQAAMREQLARGEPPAACRGCEMARYAVMSRLEFAQRAVRAGVTAARTIVRLPVLS